MRKIVIFAIVLSMLTVSLLSCGASGPFSGQWKFSKLSSVEIAPDMDESELENLKEMYSAEDEAGIEANALASFNETGVFAPCYINFEKENTYTYDPAMDREATWKFYKTGENAGFISFYAELDVTAGNPDPVVCPEIVYNAETGIMSMTTYYLGFMVTIELTKN